MEVRVLLSDGHTATPASVAPEAAPDQGWAWVDVEAGPDDLDDLLTLTSSLALDSLAVRDAVEDFDLPKLDDFGDHLVLILHGLRDDRIETYEVDCFVADRRLLLTVHAGPSPSIEALWRLVQDHAELASGEVDELLARLADVLTRRFMSVLDAFDDRIEDLVAKALTAAPDLVAEVTAVRADLAIVRRAVHPQREALDLMRFSSSSLISDAGRRRYSDVFDVATRAAQGIDAARTSLSETLEAYRGAEAREATEVTKVLTVYAAVMLPLSLVAGFFGMNFVNLPGADDDIGWVLVTAAMGAIAAVSLGLFIAAGWIRRPSSRATSAVLGRGLIEAARAPAHLVGAVFEMSISPLRQLPVPRRGAPAEPPSDRPSRQA